MRNLVRRHSVRAALRAGFTLIELLAVILIISILMVFLLPKIPEAIDNAKVTACKANMKEIYGALLIYNSKHQDLPKQSGVRFFASLITEGAWENSKSSVERLSCPGVQRSSLRIGEIFSRDESPSQTSRTASTCISRSMNSRISLTG